jgi:DUF438 domain-containing protein
MTIRAGKKMMLYKMSLEEIDAILNTLPIEITFVDASNVIKYFNQVKARVFARPKKIIDRPMDVCHLESSMPTINKIIDSFRDNKRDVVEAWWKIDGRFIYARIFAVRDKQGSYLGCMLVHQDVTEMRILKGQKPFKDWESEKDKISKDDKHEEKPTLRDWTSYKFWRDEIQE